MTRSESTIKPMPAEQALERTYLEIRSRLLDIAGALDRIERGANGDEVMRSARVQQILQALGVLLGSNTARAERVQQIFSDPYDPKWQLLG